MGKKKAIISKNKKLIPKTNPFNLKVNRLKHNVLGQEVKGSHGNPILSHGLLQLRKKALLEKKAKQRKANRFFDDRLVGASESKEEGNTLRLVRHMQKKVKKDIFNLNDEVTLTHLGQSLDHIDNDDRESDNDEALDAKFVSEAHFGGFSGKGTKQTQKEIVAQLFLENKQRKYEEKAEKQRNMDLTEKLDAEWKNLHATFITGGKKSVETYEKNDDYDIAVQELIFESRGVPTTRLVTPEEIAQREREKQKQLESERIRRMVDSKDVSKVNDHISADSICDDIKLEEIYADDDGIQAFNSDDEEDDSEGYENCNKISKKEDKLPELRLPELEKVLMNLETYNSSENIVKTVESMIKGCEVNRQNITDLFDILLTQLFEICKKSVKNQEIVTLLFQHLYALAERSPVETSHRVLRYLDEEQEHFQQLKVCKKKCFIRFETLVLLNLCSYLYSTSDFRHPVTTPAALFMSELLFNKFGNSSPDILLAQLFISKLYLKWVTLSKRFVPEAIYFLNNVLKRILREKPQAIEHSLSQISLFSVVGKGNNLDHATILSIVIDQLCSYVELYTQVPSFPEIFCKSKALCQLLPEHYQSLVIKLAEKITMNSTHIRRYVTFPCTKPKPLKLFEPLFYSEFTTRDDDKKKQNLAKRISQKIRKEEKSLLKDIRQDAKILSSEKLKQQMAADEQRKLKTKRIYQELASQEGEYKKMMKKKY